MANTLIATLGDSPVVVTAMYDLLTKQEGIQIDKVVVLQSREELIQFGFVFIEEALSTRCTVQKEELVFEDANSEEECYKFLQHLYILLDGEQKNGNMVYLSLAGGRKNMSAIMALLVPLFSNVKSLYHVIDKNEASSHKRNFKSFEELFYSSEEVRERYCFPDHDQLKLVLIPYGEQQRVSADLRAILYNPLTPEILDRLWDDHPEVAAFIDRVQNPASQLKILLTERVAKNYQDMQNSDAFHAGRFATCFEYMKNPYHLEEHRHGSFSHNSLSFHFYKRRRTAERPFYHTEPQGIHLFPKARVEKVIISGLSIEREDVYEPIGEVHLQSYDAAEPLVPLDANESILLVPLGSTPMVATQFYALRVAEGQTVREVVLLYPSMKAVRQSAKKVKEAFEYENVTCRCIEIPELEDITSWGDCEIYKKKLEETIDDIHQQHSGVPIDLLLSGGRKGMAALAMFVAQRKGMRYLYHTLIKDVKLNQRVEDETTVGALNDISKRERNDRLFLRAYAGVGPYEKFVCFKIPVLPGGKK